MNIENIVSQFKNVTQTPTGWQALCPGHDDHKPSLGIFVKNRKVVLHCFGGCETAKVLVAAGLEWADLYLDGERHPQVVAKYDYRDEAGELLYQVLRYEPKTFKVRRPDGQGGWEYNLNGTRRVPYRLDKLGAASRVVITEGEKDADTATEMVSLPQQIPVARGSGVQNTMNIFAANKSASSPTPMDRD